MDTRLYVHPNRQGNGPAVWGYTRRPKNTIIFFGKIGGPYHQQEKHPGYEVDKAKEKLAKGYVECGTLQESSLQLCLDALRKLELGWESIPLSEYAPDLVHTLKRCRQVLGMGQQHPSDKQTPTPQPRRADPKPCLAIPSQPKKTVSWMF